ncbi:MAG: GMC family oxidoreductase [Acidimicrobiales bacterium]
MSDTYPVPPAKISSSNVPNKSNAPNVPGAPDKPASLAERVETWLESFSPHARKLVRLMLIGYDLTPILSRHLKPFHLLTSAEREEWNASSTTSRFLARKEAFKGLETLIGLAHASMPEVKALIGYDAAPAVGVDWTKVPPAVEFPLYKYPDLQPGDMDTDVVVVGSGAGGAVAAYTLARAGLKVVVIEEGGFFNREHFNDHEPLERLSALYRDNGLTSTIGKPVISLPMGRAVGGTTVINSGTCFNTPEEVLHGWSNEGIPGISPDDMQQYFDDISAVLGIGPSVPEILGSNAEVFRKGAELLGYHGGVIRRNARGCHGHGACCIGCPVDAKQGMHVSYLPRAAAAGATVLSNVKVDRLWLENGGAVGVIAHITDPDTGTSRGRLTVRARATVLAAGAVFTPALLAAQGLAHTSRQLGRNLVIHPGSGTTALFDDRLDAWKGVMQSYYVDERLAQGILLEATFPPPGISYSAGTLPVDGKDKVGLLSLYPYMASCGSIISDNGYGRITLPGRSARPIIRYSLSQADTRKVIAGIAMASEIYLAAGAKEVYPMLPGLRSIKSMREVSSIREGRWRPGDLKLSAYHPMSSARMGTDPESSVVDPWGRIWDLPGAWIMDASIIPSSTRVNPQVTVMALAARCALALASQLL